MQQHAPTMSRLRAAAMAPHTSWLPALPPARTGSCQRPVHKLMPAPGAQAHASAWRTASFCAGVSDDGNATSNLMCKLPRVPGALLIGMPCDATTRVLPGVTTSDSVMLSDAPSMPVSGTRPPASAVANGSLTVVYKSLPLRSKRGWGASRTTNTRSAARPPMPGSSLPLPSNVMRVPSFHPGLTLISSTSLICMLRPLAPSTTFRVTASFFVTPVKRSSSVTLSSDSVLGGPDDRAMPPKESDIGTSSENSESKGPPAPRRRLLRCRPKPPMSPNDPPMPPIPPMPPMPPAPPPPPPFGTPLSPASPNWS
mmetsp:Transcript_38225/g.113297  ORF Transcript_38225/g.113297 Transcript_38225/m.113297 type:complete len:311 (+) Transcript_38225:1530-2462(+)